MTKFAAGNYFIEILTENGKQTQKVVRIE